MKFGIRLFSVVENMKILEKGPSLNGASRRSTVSDFNLLKFKKLKFFDLCETFQFLIAPKMFAITSNHLR